MPDKPKLDMVDVNGIDWSRDVVFASHCIPCPECGELVCPQCQEHYVDCACPGPNSEPEWGEDQKFN